MINHNQKKLVCCICGADGLKKYTQLTDKKRSQLRVYDEKYYGGLLAKLFTDAEYKFARCGNCGHYQYIENIAENKINEMYITHAKIKNKKIYETGIDRQVEKMRHFIVPILKSLKSKTGQNQTLLDYGSGAGVWSKIAKDFDFKVTSFEPYAVRSSISENLYTDWESLKDRRFDVIVCNQVLEHVVYPKILAARLDSVSHANTQLYCAVPNAGKIPTRKFLEDWPYDGKKSHILAPFQHLHGFSQKSFTKLLNDHGFEFLVRNNVGANFKSLGKAFALLSDGYFSRFSTTGGIFRRSSKLRK